MASGKRIQVHRGKAVECPVCNSKEKGYPFGKPSTKKGE